MSIKLRLIILMLFLGLIPTLTVSLVGFVTINRVLTSKNNAQVESQGASQHRKLENALQRKREEVIKLANKYELQTALSAYIAGGKKQIPSNIHTLLYNYKIDNTEILGIYLTDLESTIISTGQQSGQSGGTFIHPPRTTAGVGFVVREDADGIDKLFITTVIPVNQKEVAQLTVTFRLTDLVATTQDYTGLEHTGETIVAARNKNGAYVSLFALRFDTNAALKRNVSSLGLQTTEDILRPSATDYRDKQVIVSVKNLPIAGWVVATKIDRDEAFGTIYQLSQNLVAIVVASSIVITLISLYFARFFTKPIIMLTEKTRHIMMGDFTQRIAVTTKDEVGALATAFNRMTDELAELYEGLERKVQERTHALNQKLQELSDAKAKDDAMLQSIGEGIVVTDSAGTVLLLNQLAADMLGLDVKQTPGKSLGDAVLHDEKGEVIPFEQRPMQIALRTREKVTQEVQLAGINNQKTAFFITATPVVQQGQLIGAIQIIRDITKEKEVDRMKTEFISLASHQLRTPLSAIRWFSEMLMSGDAGELNAEQKEFAKNISGSTDRMIQLVSSLLNISRIESGRIIIDPKPTDLKELVEGITADLRAKIEERQQNLVISMHGDLPKINLDPHLIGQVYLNLLTNAIKYTPKNGEISVIISRKGEEAVTQVTDNGYGIPRAQQGKLFQKFFRADNAVKVETDGTGLGLYLVKAIIESSGGKIWFESDEGKGTTFWFSIPISGMQAKAGEVTLDQ